MDERSLTAIGASAIHNGRRTYSIRIKRVAISSKRIQGFVVPQLVALEGFVAGHW
jgi:hypothetical protein